MTIDFATEITNQPPPPVPERAIGVEVLAMRASDGEIDVGLRSVSASVGVAPTWQVRRIQPDDGRADGRRGG